MPAFQFKFRMKPVRLALLGAAAALCLVASPSLAATAPSDVTYNFTGTCTDCTGNVSASLTVQGYTEGQTLTDENLVSFTYSGSNLMTGGFMLNAAQDNSVFILHDFLSGAITSAPGSYNIDVGKNLFGEFITNEFTSFANGTWNVANDEIDFDQGVNGTWNGSTEAVSAAPEPGTWALMFAGVAMLGAMLRFGRRREGAALAA